MNEHEKLALYAAAPVPVLKPIHLPDASEAKYYTEEGAFKAFDHKRDLKSAIRQAGYEVKE